MSRHSRRRFLRRTVVGFGGYLAIASGACKPGAPGPPAPQPGGAPLPADGLLSLTLDQFRLLGAACERILPRDQDPGATDLGCVVYIDRQLAEPEARTLFGRALLGGAEQLEKQSLARYAKKFAEAAPAQQDELLLRWQRSERSGEVAFFEVLLALTLEGAFGDPSHGGNRGARGFALVGFLPPQPTPAMPGMPPMLHTLQRGSK